MTDPIKNPLIGWWLEYYFFYIKHRDLDAREDFTAMMLDPSFNMAPHIAGVRQQSRYTFAGGVTWTEYCLQRVVDEYFRNDGEAYAEGGLLDNLPKASINSSSWADSLIPASEMTLVDVNVDGPDANTTVQASEVDAALRQYKLLMEHGLTDQTYEEYLATFGIRPKREELHIPELIRFVREWTYPSNTVNPTTGAASSACSWSVAERADKDRFFREPGFIFGVSVVRPKVYMQTQLGSAVGLLRDAYSWLPAVLSDDPRSSLRLADNVAGTGGGPLGATPTEDYWVDIKDLFLHGDQYIGHDLAATDFNNISLPNAALGKRYIADADIAELFVTATTAEFVRQDGIVTMQIATNMQDTSPTT